MWWPLRGATTFAVVVTVNGEVAPEVNGSINGRLHYDEAQGIDCYTFADARPPPGVVVSVMLSGRQHDFIAKVLHLRWAHLDIDFLLPADAVHVAQRACLAVQKAVLDGLQRQLGTGDGMRHSLEVPDILSEVPGPPIPEKDLASARHELRTFALAPLGDSGAHPGEGWEDKLMGEIYSIFRLHAVRLRLLSESSSWLSRWRLMLDHILLQFYVVAVHGCLDLAAAVNEGDPSGCFRVFMPRCACLIPFSGAGPVFLRHASRWSLRIPRIFFNEIEGERSAVISRIINHLAPMIAQKSSPQLLELGVFDGYTARSVLASRPSAIYLGVDPWAPIEGCDKCTAEYMDQLQRGAAKALAPFDAMLVRTTSEKALSTTPDDWADFVFIDADHHYDAVLNDLSAVLNKVTPGGVIAGHDFTPFWFETVMAVLLFTSVTDWPCVEVSSDGVWWLDPVDREQ